MHLTFLHLSRIQTKLLHLYFPESEWIKSNSTTKHFQLVLDSNWLVSKFWSMHKHKMWFTFTFHYSNKISIWNKLKMNYIYSWCNKAICIKMIIICSQSTFVWSKLYHCNIDGCVWECEMQRCVQMFVHRLCSLFLLDYICSKIHGFTCIIDPIQNVIKSHLIERFNCEPLKKVNIYYACVICSV